MSALETKLAAALLADAGVSQVVGTRVHPVLLPQECQLPAITYQRISGGQQNSLDGYSGLEFPRIQVNCWAKTYPQAKELAKLVRAALNAASDFAAICLNDMDHYDPETKEFAVFIDFEIGNEE